MIVRNPKGDYEIDSSYQMVIRYYDVEASTRLWSLCQLTFGNET